MTDYSINTLGPGWNGRQFPDDIFKCIILNENIQISTKVSRKSVPKDLIDNIPALSPGRHQAIIWTNDG